LIILNDLHKYQYFLKKFFACNQISSTGFCCGALGANKIQVGLAEKKRKAERVGRRIGEKGIMVQ
jgi:hypothetical protein